MDSLTSWLDILFLLLALLAIPASQYMHPPPNDILSPPPSALKSPFLSVHSAPTTPIASPAASPRFMGDTLTVPQITITSDHPQVSGRPSRVAGHKRKSVSFSLSSMDELHQAAAEQKQNLGKKRPPTPYVIGPSSPYKIKEEKEGESSVEEKKDEVITHSARSVDTMGVQKSWLLP